MNRTRIASLLAGAAIAALAAAPSYAADLGPAAPPQTYVAPVAPTTYDWTGFYVGINGGYGWGRFPNSGGAALGSAGGGLVGGTVGYNWQWDQFVAGLEADLDWADVGDNDPATGTRGRLNYLGTVRGRLGYAFDRVLLYGTGGLAYGGVKLSSPFGSHDETQVGWTVGGGVEFAVWRNLSAKIEYRYTDLGRDTYNFAPPVGAVRVGYRGSSVIAGINYKFW